MRSEELIPTRHSLLRRLKDLDDNASWEEFVQIYRRLIYGVAMKSGLKEQEAEEVVQETILTVSKNIQGFQVGSERGSFKAWLLNITRWRIGDQFRKRPRPEQMNWEQRDTATTALSEKIPDPATMNLDAVWDHEWEQTLIDAAMERVRHRVNPAAYQMFDLHVLKQWPASKVARKLGVTLGKVYFAKYKVSRMIRKEVKRLEKKLV